MYPTLKLLDAGTDAAVRIAPDEPPPTMIPWKIPNKEIKLGAGARSGKRQLVSVSKVSKAELEAGFNHGLCGVAYGLPPGIVWQVPGIELCFWVGRGANMR
jgi:hypothetical protein